MHRFAYTVWFAALAAASPASAFAQERSDEWLRRPVDDRTFRTYLSFFTYEATLPFKTQALEGDELEGIRREHLSFQTTPGLRAFARIYHAAAPAGGALGWIIFLHGGTQSAKDGPGNRYIATFFARAGWNVLALDMLYFGERATGLFTTFTDPEKHARLYNQPATYLAWVSQTVKDVGRAFDLLVQERGADPKRIALVGFSRGAEVGLIVGAAERRLAAVASLYGGHFDALETGHLPAACPANYAGRISPRPLLMVNGTQDTDFDRTTAVLPLQKLVRRPSQFIWVETGHTVPPAATMPEIIRWLQQSVK